VPLLELKYIDGTWYHNDDSKHSNAMADPPNDLNFTLSFDPYIPYSSSPPAGGEIFSYTSLTSKREDIQKCLGQLYSVLPDSRVLLTLKEMNYVVWHILVATLIVIWAELMLFPQNFMRIKGPFRLWIMTGS